MEREFAVFQEKIADATARVTGNYFQLPVADADSVYRERVYCYELYHQLRCWWEEFPFSLGGEIDKIGNPHFEDGPYARSKPDFLVHEPGNMGHNLACVEVKPSSRRHDEFRDDLKKLTWFCRHARYHRGIFLVYGSGGEGGARLEEKLRRASAGNEDVDLGLIRILNHSVVGQRATMLNL